MAQVAPATRPASFSLIAVLREGWARFVRSSNHTMAKGMYGEDFILTDSLERELNARELHPYSY
jgi:hypothetical protein